MNSKPSQIQEGENVNLTIQVKFCHPKVVIALMRIQTPSPYRVVSDAYQPKSGDLRQKIISSPALVQLKYPKNKLL